MPILKTMAARRGRPPKGADYVQRIRVTHRLPPELVKALKKTARRKRLSQTEYVELALQTQIEKDNVK
jgi:hypothetical protein